MLQGGQGEVDNEEVGGHRHEGAQHRYPGVIQGIINRHDDLDPGKGYQSQGVERQGCGRLLGIHAVNRPC